jgi:hypothetical protein
MGLASKDVLDPISTKPRGRLESAVRRIEHRRRLGRRTGLRRRRSAGRRAAPRARTRAHRCSGACTHGARCSGTPSTYLANRRPTARSGGAERCGACRERVGARSRLAPTDEHGSPFREHRPRRSALGGARNGCGHVAPAGALGGAESTGRAESSRRQHCARCKASRTGSCPRRHGRPAVAPRA